MSANTDCKRLTGFTLDETALLLLHFVRSDVHAGRPVYLSPNLRARERLQALLPALTASPDSRDGEALDLLLYDKRRRLRGLLRRLEHARSVVIAPSPINSPS
jgi:hypothetical protein